jgi:DNA-binding response OmpR family regulator
MQLIHSESDLTMIKMCNAHNVILSTLRAHPGCVVSHTMLANRIWGKKLPASWKNLLSLSIAKMRQQSSVLRWQLVCVQGKGYTLGCKMIHK